MVHFRVNKSGAVLGISIMNKAKNHATLEQEIIKAIKSTSVKWSPSKHHSKSVSMRFRVSHAFHLPE